MSDDCRDGSPRSSQCGGGEVTPPTSPSATISAGGFSRSNSSTSSSACFAACASRSLSSASVRKRRVPNCSGRSNGTPTMSVLGQMPCRSGSPHGVRGGEYGACPATTTADVITASAAITVRTPFEFIPSSGLDSTSLGPPRPKDGQEDTAHSLGQ